MKFFLEFLHQSVPKQGKEIPQYYRRALIASDVLLAAYYLVCFFFFPVFTNRWQVIPLVTAAVTVFGLKVVRTASLRANLLLFSVLCVFWVAWNVHMLGWSSGVQHFLTLMLVLVFFDIYERLSGLRPSWRSGFCCFHIPGSTRRRSRWTSGPTPFTRRSIRSAFS